jgi:trehalose-phosphatase
MLFYVMERTPVRTVFPTIRILDPSFDAAAFFEELVRAPRALLMLDYDGTLAPFITDREQALPYPGVRERLDGLSAGRGSRVAVVSGRRAAEVATLLDLETPVEIWGAHGLEVLFADGHLRQAFIPVPLLQALARAHDHLDRAGWGPQLEMKPGSLAVHWRGLPADATAALREELDRSVREAADTAGLRLMPFDCGLELRVSYIDKGTAVRTLLAEQPDGTPAAYLGDDATDEDAFAALPPAALSVLVAEQPRATLAKAWLQSPAELFEFLERWAASRR